MKRIKYDAARIKHWTDQYRARVDHYELFVIHLKEMVAKCLSENGFEYPEVTGRAKDVLSFRDKIRRPGKLYKDPLRQVTDLAGIRVVVQYDDEIDLVRDALAKEFDIDEENTVDKGSELKSSQFGYRSLHLVVKLNKYWAGARRYREFAGMKAEVQIRTVLQHAWAAAEHALVYKSGKAADADYRRQLYRLASLLELVDQQFVALRESEQGRWARISLQVRRGNFGKVPVDTVSLNRYCAYAALPEQISAIATDARIGMQEVRDERLIYRELLGVCKICRIHTLAELNDRLAMMRPHAYKIFQLRDEHITKAIGRRWLACTEYLITTLLIVSQRPRLSASKIHEAMEVDEVFVDGLRYVARHPDTRRRVNESY